MSSPRVRRRPWQDIGNDNNYCTIASRTKNHSGGCNYHFPPRVEPPNGWQMYLAQSELGGVGSRDSRRATAFRMQTGLREECEVKVATIASLRPRFKPSDVYSCDETDLYLNVLSNRTLSCKYRPLALTVTSSGSELCMYAFYLRFHLYSFLMLQLPQEGRRNKYLTRSHLLRL